MGKIILNEEEFGSTGVTYDNTEQVVGTFFGKPLYQKCYKFDSSNLPADRGVIDTLTNFDMLVKIDGAFNYLNYANPIDVRCFPLNSNPPQLSSKQIFLLCEGVSGDATRQELDFNFNGLDRSKVIKLWALVQYTKTTD